MRIDPAKPPSRSRRATSNPSMSGRTTSSTTTSMGPSLESFIVSCLFGRGDPLPEDPAHGEEVPPIVPLRRAGILRQTPDGTDGTSHGTFPPHEASRPQRSAGLAADGRAVRGVDRLDVLRRGDPGGSIPPPGTARA